MHSVVAITPIKLILFSCGYFSNRKSPQSASLLVRNLANFYLCTDSCPSLVFVLTDTFYLYSNTTPLNYPAKHTSAAREQLATLTVSAL